MDDTVDTMEGGGEGVEDEREGVGGEAVIVVSVVTLAALRAGLNVFSVVPGVSQITPLAFMVSL